MSTSAFDSMPLSSSSTSPKSPQLLPESRPPPRPKPKKRSQVARACDWCRVHRIKCDSDHPCSNCKNRGGQCSNSRPMRSTTLPQAYREIERLRQRVQELELELQKDRKADKPVHQLKMPPSLLSSTPKEHDSRNSDPGLGGGGGGRAKRVWEGIHISTARSPQKT
ncbi:hypothetical protein LIPSTDRAFT_66846, partial [Lipomyces starkeyi NRRL Y-11557]